MLLAIDTATRIISLALHDGERLIAEFSWETANHHTVELAPAVESMLAQPQLAPSDLTAIAVALGPGSFTGLRIGLSLAKGMAAALALPLLGIPTLEILAAAQPPRPATLLAVLQAGRGRICAQPFSWENDAWTPAGDPVIQSWDALLDGLPDDAPTILSGEIDADGTAALTTTPKPIQAAPPADRLRRAGFLAERAWARLRAGDTDDPLTLTPIYLHQPGVPHP